MATDERANIQRQRVDDIILEAARSGRISWADTETLSRYIRQIEEGRIISVPRRP